MRDAGFGAIFCNIGDFDPAEWQLVRQRATAAGVTCGPWLRTTDGSNTFRPDLLAKLIGCADAWHAPLIVNSEIELKGTHGEITSFIDAQLGARDAAMSVEAWPFDNVEWFHLAKRPVLPQLFRGEVPNLPAEQALRDIWHAYGVECCVLTFGSYRGSTPHDYDMLTPFGVFTADDCGGNYAAWAARGTAQSCVQAAKPAITHAPPILGSARTEAARTTKPRVADTPVTRSPVATMLIAAWNAWNRDAPAAWRRDNPNEWKQLRAYWNSPRAKRPAGVKSKTGRMLLAIAEARHYAEGTHK